MRKIKKYVGPAVLWLSIVLLLTACSGKEYTVTLDANYPGAAEPAAVSSKAMEAAEPPVREGYTFLGWFQDAGLTEPWDEASGKVKSDMTLYAGWDRDTGDDASGDGSGQKDFSSLTTPGSQESAYEYEAFFRPAVDGVNQPYVGDTMPYYEDGTYYIYYLKESGDSYNHSAYLATTTDFLSYTEYDEPVLEASRSGGQDSWIGTGSVVKVDSQYYFFYTGHTDSAAAEYKEKIMSPPPLKSWRAGRSRPRTSWDRKTTSGTPRHITTRTRTPSP